MMGVSEWKETDGGLAAQPRHGRNGKAAAMCVRKEFQMTKPDWCPQDIWDLAYPAVTAGTVNGSRAGNTVVEAVSRAIMKAKEAKWQPVETAPKDGTRVLLFHHYPVIGGWRNLWYKQGGKDMYAWVCTEDHKQTALLGVTHWMPIPDDPLLD